MTKGYGIVIQLQNLANSIDALSRMDQSVSRSAETAMSELADETLAIVKMETPKGESKKLSDSTQRKKMSKFRYQIVQSATAGPGSGGGRQNVDYLYGRGVRSGARPPTGGTGIIMPRARKALYWSGLEHPIPMVGPPVTRRHPGNVKPQDYVGSSMQRLRPKLNEIARNFSALVKKNMFKRFRTGRG